LQVPELHAFAVADETSYYLFVVNEDEAAPAETALRLDSWSDVPPGSDVIACLVADGCACAWLQQHRSTCLHDAPYSISFNPICDAI
jgi:hypothetical protein